MLAAEYTREVKNGKEEIDCLGVVFGRLNVSRMRNDSWHGRRYTEHRKSREKDSLWRVGES